jgi:hypothetical protein
VRSQAVGSVLSSLIAHLAIAAWSVVLGLDEAVHGRALDALVSLAVGLLLLGLYAVLLALNLSE